MKKLNFLGTLLFWLTILSFPISLILCIEIGEVEVFSTAGIVRYSWIMWLFIPIGIISLLIGIKLKHNNQKYRKNYIVAFVVVSALLIFGSYRFVFFNFSYDDDILRDIEKTANVELPNKTKVASVELFYTTSYVKLTDDNEKTAFENQLYSSDLWQNNLASEIKYALPTDIPIDTSDFDYFLFYCVSTGQYNEYPQDKECECVFMAYDCDYQKLVILSNYVISL